MNVTKEVINDLYPLYLEQECSADSRALVEEYLQRHPQHARELRQISAAPLPRTPPSTSELDETQSLRLARRAVRRRSWLMAFAIFFSLTPFSFVSAKGWSLWMLRDAPRSALVYAVLAVGFWISYAVQRRRARSL